MGGQVGRLESAALGSDQDAGISDSVATSPVSGQSSNTNNERTSPLVPTDLKGKFKNLIGNTEKLSLPAQKLFALGRVYLTGNSQDITQNDGFPALFQMLPGNKCADTKCIKEETTINDCDHQSHVLVETNADDTVASHSQSGATTTPLKRSIDKNRTFKPPLSFREQCAQTYVQWKAGHDLLNLNTLCFAPSNTIYLLPLEDFPDFCADFKLNISNLTVGFFEMLQGFMQIFFSGMEIVILPPVSIQGRAWKVRSRFHEVTKQKQYCVTDLFPSLQTVMPRNGHSIVGVVWTDLYPENYNFVLGEASYAHKAAVISFGRYETSNYNAEHHQDVSEINGRLMWKLLRTLSHEVCHLFGLSHCVFFQCAMNESSTVSEALSQPLFLCPVCLRKLQQACGFDVLERYQLLLKFIQGINYQLPDSVEMQNSSTWLENCVSYIISVS